MLVFVDESGDPGFKMPKGSSALFVAAMVIFENSKTAQDAQQTLGALRNELRVHPEFKFSQSRDEVRDSFFEVACRLDFRLRSIVVRKEAIYSPHLREKKDDFYRYLVRMMLKHDSGRLNRAKVVIDGSGDHTFRKDMKRYLSEHAASDQIREVAFKDSRRDPLLQLADMCVGAIARSYRFERKHPDRWKRMLASSGRIDDIWEFK